MLITLESLPLLIISLMFSRASLEREYSLIFRALRARVWMDKRVLLRWLAVLRA